MWVMNWSDALWWSTIRTPVCVKGMQHGHVQLHQRPVTPQVGRAAGVQTQTSGDGGELVISVHVGEVAGTDLRAHVPAVERCGRMAQSPGFQRHPGDRRNGVPAQVELGEPLEFGVPYRYLQQ